MIQVCRDCGCTNLSACPGGCWWVDDDLCSSCNVATDVATGRPLSGSELVAIVAHLDGSAQILDDVAGVQEPAS